MVVQQNSGGAKVTAMFERGDAVTWQARSEQQHPYSLGSLRLDRGFGPLKLDIGLGLLREEDTLLGSSLGPVFGISGATTRQADARAEMNFSRNWSVSASIRQGWSCARPGGRLFNKADIVTLGFSVDFVVSQL